MPNGPMEEAGKAANSFIEAMKSQPLALALCVMNIALVALFYFFLIKVYERRQEDMALLYQQNQQVQKMLYECVPHPSKQ